MRGKVNTCPHRLCEVAGLVWGLGRGCCLLVLFGTEAFGLGFGDPAGGGFEPHVVVRGQHPAQPLRVVNGHPAGQ
ncbi:hypothetical protein [Micromonospora maris]|uniref:hypothetical protein n=1 Tax=Micromonospora maris TaxID=1003110 RepID=UPI002E156031|nr:hypothetical protein OG712_23660 [Micromonospora maris]